MKKRKWSLKTAVFVTVIALLTAACERNTSAAVLEPTNVSDQGTVVVKSYSCNVYTYRDTVGTSYASNTYQIDLTGVDRLVVTRSIGYGKCGDCNGSSGYPGASMSVGGVSGYSPAYGSTIELSDMAAYGFGVTDVTISVSATINNVCATCGRCSTEVSSVTAITTYSYPPAITKQPESCTAAAGETAVFKVAGSKITGWQWQKKEGDTFVPLTDTTLENGMSYSGSTTDTLTIGAVRYAADSSVYRCTLLGTDGKELTSNEAVLTVTDTTPPYVTVTKSPEGWTNQDILLRLSAGDLDMGLAEQPYSWDGGISFGTNASFDVKENGTYPIAVKDKAGNVYRESLTVDTIDRIAPTLSISANTIEETTSPVELYLTAEDKESGLAEQAYYYQGRWNTANTFAAASNGSYEIMVRDRAGNTTKAVHEISNIKIVTPPGGGGNGGSGSNESTDGGSSGGGSGESNGNTGTDVKEIVPQAVLLPLPIQKEPVPAGKKKQTQTPKKELVKETDKDKTEKKTEIVFEERTAAPEENEKEVTVTENSEMTETPEPTDSKMSIAATILLAVLGILLFFFLLMLLFFGVLIERKDTEGDFKICGIRFVYISRRKWNLQIGKLLEQYDSVRLSFGILFILLFEGWSLLIHTKGQRSGEFEMEISQKLLADRKQLGRR